jgi:hypothetical protein
MKMSRPSNLLAALIALVSILFMQFAIAAYTCPVSERGYSDGTATVLFSGGAPGMPGCETLDLEKPNLCQAESQKRGLSLEKPGLPNVPAFAPSILVTTVSPIPPIVPTKFSLLSVGVSSRTTAPPLAIRNCCFRI